MPSGIVVVTGTAPQLVIQIKERGLFARAHWYVFVGWWLSGF
jgi:hypothetical protein